ncbi:MAG TPA: DUF433 domain-containing protein [Nakamurella sp.]
MSTDRRIANAAADGCYEASRASALSGVPLTTVYWWARHGVVVPSVSPVREKLWSYSDLIALRVVSWLRHAKPADVGELPASPMPQVRQALTMLGEYNLDPWSPSAPDTSPLLVDCAGRIFLRINGDVVDLEGQRSILHEQVLELTAPFTSAGGDGPNLLRPRPHLRIVPAKVAGEPHIEHSRLTSRTVAALADRGFSPAQIAAMYDEPEQAIREAIDLERQLAGSVVAA